MITLFSYSLILFYDLQSYNINFINKQFYRKKQVTLTRGLPR